MHEVLHVSTGPRANWLSSKYFNLQTEYFVYSDEEITQSFVDPQVHFAAGKEYTPRALFWDFRRGFGRLERISSVYESKETPNDVKKLITSQIPAENRYWTDKIKIPLHPNAQNEIPDWEYDPVDFPNGRLRGSESMVEFREYYQGQSEYHELNKDGDYLDHTLRREMERCDNPSGMNIVTEFSGWAGFSGALLEEFRDELSSKLPVFTWAGSTSLRPLVSTLEAYLDFSELSTLLIPLKVTASPEEAEHVGLFETVALMSSLRQNRLTMNKITEDLTLDTSCNIISVPRWESLSSQEEAIVKTNMKINRPGDTSSSDKINPAMEDYYCPQPIHGPSECFTLQLSDHPLNLRKLVPPRNHELKEKIYGLTEPYIWSYQSDSGEYD